MSSGCGDVLSLADLQTAKKHQIFEAEVITGKSGGVAGGADIDYATNQVTGQIQKTLPAVLRDAGFRPAAFTFATGGTLGVNDADVAVLWPLSAGGDGDYYNWQGALPKVIPASSTPASTGGVAPGAWVPVGDLSLRTELERGQFRTDATSIYYVPGVTVDLVTDNRAAVYAFPDKIYIPTGVTIRCNFRPEDDVRKFIGNGTVLSRDPWGNEHIFNVGLASNGSAFSPTQVINQGYINYTTPVTIGVVGDSITDGAWGKQAYTPNPNAGSPTFNLNSTNYNHSAETNGGSRSWFNHVVYILNHIVRRRGNVAFFKACNASLSGMKLSDGWAYRNFDYGFFQNAAYGNKAPNVCLMSMGWNDEAVTNFADFKDKFDAFIRKAWGYGSAVGLVTLNRNARTQSTMESAIKDWIYTTYPNVQYIDASDYLEKYTDTRGSNIADLYVRPGNTYDIIHPQPMGHAALGSAVAYELAKNHIPTISRNKTIVPYTNKYWDCVGSTSGVHYQATARPGDVNGYLTAVKFITGFSPASENVTMSTIVFCEDDDTYLTVLEPFTHDFTATGRNHTIRVLSPVGNGLVDSGDEAKRTIVTGYKLSSNGTLLGEGKTLTTGVCKLRYGLNVITINYDGAPKNVYIPYLIGSSFAELGTNVRGVRLGFGASTAIQRVFKGTTLDKVSHARMSKNPASFLPNTFGGYGQLIGSARVRTMTDLNGIVLFYDDVIGTGVIVQRRGGTFYIGNIVGGAIVEASMTNTTVPATGAVNISIAYTSVGTSSVTVYDDASASFSSSYPATGGTLGVYTPTAATYIMDYQLNYLDA